VRRGWGGRRLAELRRLVTETYGNRCHICALPINLALRYPHPGSLSLDHVLPRSRGGSDAVTNLRPVHLRCNLSRGARPVSAVRPAREPASGRFFGGDRPDALAPPSVSPRSPQKNARNPRNRAERSGS